MQPDSPLTRKYSVLNKLNTAHAYISRAFEFRGTSTCRRKHFYYNRDASRKPIILAIIGAPVKLLCLFEDILWIINT